MPAEISSDEERMKWRYRRLAKLLVLLAVIYTLGVAILILGTYYLGWGYRPAGFFLEQWILSAIILISVFIFLEILVLFIYTSRKRKIKEAELPKPIFTKGKELLIYTIPLDAKGGIFSKTFIQIDTNRVLNLRYQMIPPTDLWEKK